MAEQAANKIGASEGGAGAEGSAQGADFMNRLVLALKRGDIALALGVCGALGAKWLGRWADSGRR